MQHAEVIARPIHSEIALVRASGMEGLVHSETLVAVFAKVPSVLVREGSGLAVMSYRIVGRIDYFHIVGGGHSGVGPCVIRLILTGIVVPE